MGSVGQVTVDVIPDAEGFQNALKGQLPLKAMDRMGQDMAKRFSKSWGQHFGSSVGKSMTGLSKQISGSSSSVQRAASKVGTTAGTSMSRSAATAVRQQMFPNLNPVMQRTMSQSIQSAVKASSAASVTSSLGRYGIVGDLRGTPFGRQLTQRVTQAQESSFRSASRHHNMGQFGSAAAFMLPQVGTGPISGMLAMTAQTPKMMALAAGVAGVGAALYGVVQATQLAAVGMQGYASLAQYALQQAGELENTKIALGTLMGSEEKAQAMLEKAIDFAKTTPFDLPSVTTGIKQLKAYGFANKELLPMLKDIGDASSALGLGSYGIQRMVMAFGQVKARGTFMADEARQLTEAGIPAVKAIADAYSEAEGKVVSYDEVRRRMEAGEVKAAFAIAAVRKQMQATYGGSMEAQALTFLGTMEKMKDAANIGLQVSMQPALKSLASTIQQVLPAVEDLSFVLGSNLGAGIEGFAKTVTSSLSGNLEKLGDAFGPLLAKLGPRFGAIIEDLATTFTNFAPQIASTVDGFYNMTKSVTGVIEVMSQLSGVVTPMTDLFSSFWSAARGGIDQVSSLLGNQGEVALDQVAEAQAQVTGLGREIASTIERVNPTMPDFVPEIDIEGLERGSSKAVAQAIQYLEANPEQADILDIDPAALKQKLSDAVTGLPGGTILDGEKKVSLDVELAKSKAESQLLDLAAQVANVGKGVKFDVDASSLQNIATALPQLQNLIADNKTLKAVLDIDSSEVPKAKAEIQGLIAYLQYAQGMSIDPKVGTANIQAGMSRFTAVFDQWIARANTRNILIGAKIKPEDLANFSPEAIQRLMGNSGRKILLDLGLKPGQVAGFQAQLRALIQNGAGSTIEVPVKPKIEGGAGANIGAQVGRAAATVKIPTEYKPPEPLKLSPAPVELSTAWEPGSFETLATEAQTAGVSAGESWTAGLLSQESTAQGAGLTVASASTGGMGEGAAGANGAGTNAGASFVSGVSSYTDAAYSAGAALGAAASQGMRDNLDINSPSKVTMAIGHSVGEGFEKGIKDRTKRVEAAGRSLAKKGAAEPFGKTIVKAFKSVARQSDKFQVNARKLDLYFKGFQNDTMEVLDFKSVQMDEKAYQLGRSAWALEQAQQRISTLSNKLDDQQDRLDRAVNQNKDNKPNDDQKKQQRKIDRRRRFLELQGRQIDLESWQNRKQERVTEKARRALDAQRRVLEEAAAINEARWGLQDTLADLTLEGSSDGIAASITDIQRQLDRGQIPASLQALARDIIKSLQTLQVSAKVKEEFEAIASAADPKSLRDLSFDGVKDWVKQVQDAIDGAELGDAAKTSLSATLNSQVASIQGFASRLERISKGRDLKQQLIDSVGGSIDWNKTANPASLSRALRKRTAQMNTYAQQLVALRQGGLSDQAIQRIAAMDPEQAAKFTARLVSGGTSAITDFNNAIAGFEASVQSVGDLGAAAAWAETGQQAAQGFVAGMESQESVIRQSMRAIAEGMLSTWKSVLGIASPSKVFAEAAAWIPRGMVKGIESERDAVQLSVRRLVSVPKMPVVPVAGQVSGLAAGVGNEIKIDVHPREHMDERQTARLVARELAWEVS